MAISIEFWRSSDGTIDVESEFNKACEDFPEKRSFFESTLESLAKRAARGQLSAGTFLLQVFIYEMLKKTALPEEMKESMEEFEDAIGKLNPKAGYFKVRVDQVGDPWREYWKNWAKQPVRKILKDTLRMLLTFRPPRESYATYVPFMSHGFQYEFVANFDVERDGSNTTVTFWRIQT
jgi:hypothetical protein